MPNGRGVYQKEPNGEPLTWMTPVVVSTIALALRRRLRERARANRHLSNDASEPVAVPSKM